MYLISLRYIKEVEVRIGDNLIEEIIGEAIGLLIEIVVKVIEGMEEVEVILGEEHFEEEVIFEVDMIIIGWIEVGKTEDYGGNLGQEKEKEGVGCHLVLDQVPELVPIKIGLGVLNAENMTTLQMNVVIGHLIVQIGIVIVQDQYLYIWQIVIQDQIWIIIQTYER